MVVFALIMQINQTEGGGWQPIISSDLHMLISFAFLLSGPMVGAGGVPCLAILTL